MSNNQAISGEKGSKKMVHNQTILEVKSSVSSSTCPKYYKDNNYEDNIVDLDKYSILRDTRIKLSLLYKRKENWNDYNSPKPKKNSIEKAKEFVENLYDELAKEGYPWETPSVSSDENGNVFLNWGDGQKELDLYIEENQIMCIQAWGEDINDEMKEYIFDLNNISIMVELWRWLNK